jgi:acetyl-CoA carboxylase carboxyltransferase component
MVAAFTGLTLTVDALGGAAVHSRHSGLAAAVVGDEDAALAFLTAVLSYLPAHVDEEPPVTATPDPAERLTPEAGDVLPPSPAGSYDVRDVLRSVADDGELLELWPGWAPNVVVGLAAVTGRPVGVVANQPLALAGTLDIPASQKAARWVALCDSFNLPILTFVDTPGFFPGKPLEWRGMIRHGAQLVGTYARATVPRICVVLRKAYGGAFIVMDCKTMGNDLCLAWPTAEVAVMGARGAVQILHRRQDDEVRARLEDQYSVTHLNPYVAAERGYVDAVIAPADTRREIAAALAVLADKRELLPARHHDNLPL